MFLTIELEQVNSKKGIDVNLYQLCFADNGDKEGDYIAYFTKIDLRKQWGDDWDDIPYEHNCGLPYDTFRNDIGQRKETTILEIPFTLSTDVVKVIQPKDYFSNSVFSVKMINEGAIPWFFMKTVKPENKFNPGMSFYAGISLNKFLCNLDFVKSLIKMNS